MTTAALDGSSPRCGVGRRLAGLLAAAFGVTTLVEGGDALLGAPAASAGPFDLLLYGLATLFRPRLFEGGRHA